MGKKLKAKPIAKKDLKKPDNEKADGADQSYFNDDSNQLPPTDIISYNELRSCADLFRMYKDKVLDINPDFQREEVWAEAQKTRFIDSLIKKLPIPSMCFSLDYKTEKWQVIDGLQRMSSIIKFLDEERDWRLSNLEDIDEKIAGEKVSDIKKLDNGVLFTRLANLTIPITVLRCDYSKKNHTNYLFTIFHRLNTGGLKLTNQEIRNAIYNGEFNTLLKGCNQTTKWRKLLGLKENKSYRFSKEELILRFFAFFDKVDMYEGSLSRFLNEYMADNKHAGNKWLQEKRKLFEECTDLIYEKIANKKTLQKTSNAYVEALLFGVGKNYKTLEKKSAAELKAMYKKLLAHGDFSEENLREGLASKGKVQSRLKTAKGIFAGK